MFAVRDDKSLEALLNQRDVSCGRFRLHVAVTPTLVFAVSGAIFAAFFSSIAS